MLGLYLSDHDNVKNKERASNYSFSVDTNQFKIKKIFNVKYDQTYKLNGVTFPFKMKDLNKLEGILDCTFNIYTIIKDEHIPLRITKKKDRSLHMNFCVIEEFNEETREMKSHCMYIKNLNAFLQMKKTNKTYYPCETCTQIFRCEESLSKHVELCQKLMDGDCAKLEFP